jgi:hypothetical protein
MPIRAKTPRHAQPGGEYTGGWRGNRAEQSQSRGAKMCTKCLMEKGLRKDHSQGGPSKTKPIPRTFPRGT